MKAEYKELRRNLLVLSMAAAMLFQIVPDNMQTQAAAASRKEGSRKAGDTTAALDGIAPVVTEDAATDLTGSITLTAAQESGLDAMVFTAAEEASEEEAQDPAEEDTQTAEATEETADTEIVPAESADVLAEEAAAESTEEEAAAEETAEETASSDAAEEETAAAAEDSGEKTTPSDEDAAEETEAAAAEESADVAEETVDLNVSTKNSSWTGQVLNSYVGAVYGPSGGKEVYYNMNMSQVVANLKSAGYEGDYWVRDDGVKMFGSYVMVAACYSVHPYGSFVETTLGTAIVCDTGTFAYSYPQMLDVAVTW
ncbi:MAG: hypothetical protein PUE63_09060 [Lachnospiraceae bacterium]|nr:hypothetical protein [Lachnospiraceae bacterium]